MVFNVTITIGAIISAQPLGSIIFRWFSDKKLSLTMFSDGCQLDFSDGQFLMAMRCRCFFHNSDAMSMFLAISYHRNRCDYFCSTIGTDCFPMFFQFQNQCLGMIFCGKPKNNGLYDMLKFATNCAYISALSVCGTFLLVQQGQEKFEYTFEINSGSGSEKQDKAEEKRIKTLSHTWYFSFLLHKQKC